MKQARQLAFALSMVMLAPMAWGQAEDNVTQVFDDVTDRAREMAASDYEDNPITLPEPLRDIDYDVYRSIRFNRESALWNDDDNLYSVQLFHPGFLFNSPVKINLVEDGEIRHLPFQKAFFRYDDEAAPLAEHDLTGAGYAGLRLHYPLNTEEYHDEFLVFQGASYFRMVGRQQGYGLSARGLAIDTASPGGEEFPAFREFWLFKPDPESTRMQIVALLDSPSVAGAYRFTVHPGADVKIDVEARLFARETVEKLGIAPLTSMFFHGDARPYKADDFRPQVHDSEGLLVLNQANEWVWRPLSNPRDLSISRLQGENPRGFGLVQRDRDFDNYLDLEARYDKRPSHWIVPQGDWGAGSVELVEIPSDSETNDNIVSFWVPEDSLEAGEERTYRYRMSTFDAHPPNQELAHVIRTRQGWAAIPGQSDPPPRSHRQFVVDFQGDALATLDESHPVEAWVTASNGETEQIQVQRLPDGKTWRASFRLHPGDDTPVDLRMGLTLRNETLSETWNYVWNPNEIR